MFRFCGGFLRHGCNLQKMQKFLFCSSKEDYYKTMNVSNSASEEEIKKSYYKLAKMYHPDLSKGNEEKFKRINEAYSVLSDPTQRRQYDMRGQSAESNRQYEQKDYSSHYDTSSSYGYQNPYESTEERERRGAYRRARRRRGREEEDLWTRDYTEDHREYSSQYKYTQEQTQFNGAEKERLRNNFKILVFFGLFMLLTSGGFRKQRQRDVYYQQDPYYNHDGPEYMTDTERRQFEMETRQHNPYAPPQIYPQYSSYYQRS